MTDPDNVDRFNDPEQLRQLRERQKGRAMVMGLVLGGLAILFYLITIAKIGVAG